MYCRRGSFRKRFSLFAHQTSRKGRSVAKGAKKELAWIIRERDAIRRNTFRQLKLRVNFPKRRENSVDGKQSGGTKDLAWQSLNQSRLTPSRRCRLKRRLEKPATLAGRILTIPSAKTKNLSARRSPALQIQLELRYSQTTPVWEPQ